MNRHNYVNTESLVSNIGLVLFSVFLAFGLVSTLQVKFDYLSTLDLMVRE